jgi:hypothetical protein
MIEIKLATGESLELYASTALSLEINNPLFDAGIIKGSLIYPFDFPATPANRKNLGFPAELLNKVATAGKYQAGIWFEGNLFKSGILQIEKVVDDKITATFVAGAGGLNSVDLSKKTERAGLRLAHTFQLQRFYRRGPYYSFRRYYWNRY